MKRDRKWFNDRIKPYNCPCLFALPELHKAINQKENIPSEELVLFIEELFREDPSSAYFHASDDCWTSVVAFLRKWVYLQPDNNHEIVLKKLIEKINPFLSSTETLRIVMLFPLKNKKNIEKELINSLINFL